jgi:hypothetical protein
MKSVSAFMLWMGGAAETDPARTTQAVAEKKLRTSIQRLQQFRQLLIITEGIRIT